MQRFLIASLFAVLLAVSACGGSGDEATPAPLASEPPPTTPVGPAPTVLQAGIQPLAGTAGGAGHLDGPVDVARLQNMEDLAFDASGNLYFMGHGTLRRVSPDRTVTTIAGAPGQEGVLDGTGSQARLAGRFIAADAAGNVYLANGNIVRRISPQGVVTTVAGVAGAPLALVDGPRSTARFVQITGVALDGDGSLLVIDNTRIRRVTPAGDVRTLSDPNDGAPSVHRGIVRAPDGAFYVADLYRVYRYVVGGAFTLVAGSSGEASVDGTGPAAKFTGIDDLAMLPGGDVLVVQGRTVRRMTPQGVVTTVSQPALLPAGVAVDSEGNIYAPGFGGITRYGADGQAMLWAGLPVRTGSQDGPAATASFVAITGLAADAQGNVYVSEGCPDRLRKIDAAGQVSTIAQLPPTTPHDWYGDLVCMRGLARDTSGNLYTSQLGRGVVRKVLPDGTVTLLPGLQAPVSESGGTADGISPSLFWGVAVDAQGNAYLPDTNRNVVWKVTPAGQSSILAGSLQEYGAADGDRATARLETPKHVSVDSKGNVFVIDANRRIRRISPAGDVVTLGTQTVGATAVDSAGNLYVAVGARIDRLTPAGEWSTVAGTNDTVGLRAGPLPGSLPPISALAVIPNPPNTVGTRLAVGVASSAVVLVTLPE